MLTTNHNILFKAIILALCVISFVHVFLFPIYGIHSNRTAVRTYLDFEQSLCMNNIRHGKKVHRRARCPQDGIVTIMQGGRLGNQMWEYASVWALARRTGLESYIPRCIRLKLDQIFESLTISSFEEIAHCSVQLNNYVKSLDAWNVTNQSIILPKYSIQPDLVLTWVHDIIQEFTIKRKLRDKSQQILRLAVKNSSKQHTFVGVHVRRTDYIGYLMRKHATLPANIHFYKSAMAYFQQKYPNVVFMFVSDEPLWCAKNFGHYGNVFIASKNYQNSPALDLAILASCNHSIYDYGTFGEWGAILAGGETIYYNLTHHSSVRIGQIMKNWHTI